MVISIFSAINLRERSGAVTMSNRFKPKSVMHSLGKKRAGGLLILFLFMLFFYGPLVYMFTLAFAETYNYPSIMPTGWGFKWWEYVMGSPRWWSPSSTPSCSPSLLPYWR